MKFYLARTMVILLFFMATACSLPWQNGSSKTEDKLQAKSADETLNLRPESKIVAPEEAASQSSSGLNLKSKKDQAQDSELLLNQALGFFSAFPGILAKGRF